MRDRLEALRAGFLKEDCDAYFSFSPPANEYLSGFHGTTSAIALTANEAHFLCDFRYTEQARAQVEGFEVQEVNGTIETRLGECLKRLGVKCAGFDPSGMTVSQHAIAVEAFGGETVALGGLLASQRMVKSPAEIARIRAASASAEAALSEVLDGIEAGITESELAGRIEYAFRRHGAQKASFDTIVLFGARSSLPHGLPGETRLQDGDILLIDCGCVTDSYCSDLTRTWTFGRIPGAWFEQIYEIVLRAQRAAIGALRPGVRCSDLDAVARDIIRESGYGDHFGHGLGHGVGLDVHEAPRLNMQSEATLETGMVVTIEPGIYLPGQGGVRIEDLVVVTDSGCDVLTCLPKEFEVLNV